MLMKLIDIAKKCLSSVVATIFASLVVSQTSLCVSATENDVTPQITTGDGIWESAAESGAFCANDRSLAAVTFPSSVDNSSSVYFPSIGNQGEMNSCAGWSTTYYQYTYEVNKMLGVQTTSSNAYSPSWTYNYINGGVNAPTYLNSAYDVLKNHGAMKLSDYAHSPQLATYSFSWSTNTQKMVDALRYRVYRYYVNCSSSYDLYNVKNELSNGKIGVIWTNSDGWTTSNTSNGDTVIIKGSSYGNGGHFMTIVGYDDNVTTTYNGATFTGAFKLANSWGTEATWPAGNNGFIWVAYDALNASSLLGNWDPYYYNRTQIFGYNNEVNFVNIETYNAYYVGRVQYISDDPWRNNIYGDISTTASTSKFSPSTYPYYYPSDLANPEYREIVFDYFDNPNLNVANYINSQFTTKIANSTTNTTYRIYLSIMDNRCKKILPNDTVAGSINSNGGSYSRTFAIGLKKGRISSYDNGNITTSDVSALSSYLMGNNNLSTLQGYLADMNDDNILNGTDLTLLLQAMNNQNRSVDVLDLYLPELGITVRDFIISQYGVEFMHEVEMQFSQAA